MKTSAEHLRNCLGAGEASVSLSDPENILTCGIDIHVQPPGKIVRNLESLSGGEKALVAISLYFCHYAGEPRLPSA